MATINGTIGNDALSGTDANDLINGLTGSDTINGDDGNDTLDGGTDIVKDILIGGEGSDTYVIHDLKDVITEKGTVLTDVDTIRLAMDYDDNLKKEGVAFTLKDTNIEAIDGSDLESEATITGNAKKATTITGGDLNDSLVGGTAADILNGGDGENTLFGGNDTISDALTGGADADTYVLVDTNDIITDASEANTIKLSSSFKGTSLDLSETDTYDYTTSNISTIDATAVSKGLVLTANAQNDTEIQGGKGKDSIIGGNGSNVLHGNGGNDTIIGGLGNNDIYGDAGNDYLIGGEGDSNLYGGAGNDTLAAGGSGENYMDGGAGNDTYLFDSSENLDNITVEDESGIDTVKLTSDDITEFTLYETVENLDASALSENTTTILNGNASANTITGGAGADSLNGKEGADKMIGGLGNDTYTLDNSKDTVVEKKDGEEDTVILGEYDFGKTKAFTLAANVEKLDLGYFSFEIPEGQEEYLSAHRMTINGNSLNNTIEAGSLVSDYIKIAAGAGNDTFIGAEGNDSIDGGAGNDSLFGGTGDDVLLGNAGDDTLYGTEGSNTLNGGAGNDTYLIDGTEDATTIIDSKGVDTIRLVADENGEFLPAEASLLNYTMIENLDASEITATDLTLTGNNLDNVITGGSGYNVITGGKGNDTLMGGSANDDFVFAKGDGKDLIAATDAADVVKISSELSTDDMLFYSDEAGNLYIDYTDNAVGSDVIKISAGEYDNGTMIQVGEKAISIADVIDSLGTSYASRTAKQIAKLTLNDKTTQALAFASLWSTDRTFSITGDLAETLTATRTATGINTIKLVPDGTGAFVGADTELFPDSNVISIEALSTNANTIQNVDASDVTSTDLNIIGNDLANNIIGGNGDDTIVGGLGNDTLIGGIGNDELQGDAGTNDLNGGVGDDTYLITKSETTTINEIAGEGNDTVKLLGTGFSTVSASSYANIENIDASAISGSNLSLLGDGSNNVLIGGSGSDYIAGGLGDDTLIGGAGMDNIYGNEGTNDLRGGLGNDMYYIKDTETSTITELSGEGTDTVTLVANSGAFASGNYTLSDNIENISATTISTDLTLTCNDVNNNVYSGVGNDIIQGGAGNDSLDGGSGNDSIDGGADDDYLVGSTGNDTIFGGDGNDGIYGNSGNNELLGGDGNDTISGYTGTDLIDGGAGNDSIYGHAGNDTIQGGSGDDSIDASVGNDSIDGGAGNDYLNGGDGNDIIQGDIGNDTLIGGNGDDNLYGDSGTNDLQGGVGNDTYYISDTGTSTITEQLGEGNYDTVSLQATSGAYSPASYTLAANVEWLDASAITATNLTLTGNDLNNNIFGGSLNDTINGGIGNDELYGNSGDDSINGGDGNDYLYGGAGDDCLQGDAGTNSLNGGTGNDTYLISGAETTAVNEATGEGIDTIKLMANAGAFAPATRTLSINVDNLDASAITVTDLTLTGNNIDNIITGGAAYNTISGLVGNDTIYGGDNGNYLCGDAGDDALYGGIKNDCLDGGTGSNTLSGGAGDDSYFIHDTETATNIVDTSGTDSIQLFSTAGIFAPGSFSLAGYADIENLLISGTPTNDLTLTGNDLGNFIQGGSGNDTIDGGLGNDEIYSYNGNDYLIGGDGNDTLNGLSGDDVLQGDSGANSLNGGDGNDTYYISDNETSTISEYSTQGTDTVKLIANAGAFAPAAYILEAEVENLDASATTATDLTLTGNDLANAIIGGAGNDTIIGGAGNDTLTGGLGADTYSFNEGDQKDFITTTEATDIINIDSSTGISTDDFLFYTDQAGNLFIDYTDGAANSDVIEIASGQYDDATTIQVGDASISIGTIIPLLGVYAGLNTTAISNLNAGDKTTQAADIASNWTVPISDNTYLVDGNMSATIDATLGAGINTIELVADGGAFVGSTGLFATPNTISIEALSTTPNTIQNVDASDITATDLKIIGNNLNNEIIGGACNDTLISGFGDDTFLGAAGDNYALISGGNDTLIGGAGDDTYILDGVGSTTIVDSSGNDTVFLTETAGTFAPGAFSLAGYADVENINAQYAYNTNLLLTGNDLNNHILGGWVNDTVYGGLGDDTIEGYEGNDNILGEAGSDALYGNDGDDIINGGDGDDYLYGEDGNDRLQGGTGTNNLYGGLGNDTYNVSGNETTTIYESVGQGTDTVNLLDSSGAFAAGTYTLNNNVENLDAGIISVTNLTLTGNGSGNVIYGGAANDSIYGGLGNDMLQGGSGNDQLQGGAGTNDLYGGDGNDTYLVSENETTTINESAGQGIDTVRLLDNEINGYAPGAYTLEANVENLDAHLVYATNLTLTGNNLDNKIEGSNMSKDTIIGGLGNDFLNGYGDDDFIEGDAGDDFLFGAEGNDIVDGGLGNDTIMGGEGNDTLTGGDGADNFSFYEGAQKDLITATDATDIISVDTSTGITSQDLFFYTDGANNLCIDYTAGYAVGDVGDDVIKISSGNYNGSTTVQVGTSTISVNQILSYMGGYITLDAAAIANLETIDVTAQYTTLTGAVGSWTAS